VGNTRCSPTSAARSESGFGSITGQLSTQVEFPYESQCEPYDTIHTKVMPLFLYPLNDGTGKCDAQKCPFANVAADTCACGIDECTKKVHVECYTRLVLVQVGKETLPPLPDECLACTKKHCCAVIKLAKPVKAHRWGNDAKPETPTVTGEWILVDWLTKTTTLSTKVRTMVAIQRSTTV